MADRKLKLVTHNGSFHADDLFACATLCLYLDSKGEDYEIIRSRDVDTINSADYVFDVGGIYDPEKNRFDHHQKGGAGIRKNMIEYASFGLVWKHFGPLLCDNNMDVWELIDREIASPIDANDNGHDLVTPKFSDIFPYVGTRPFLIFSPTWQEDEAKTDDVFRSEVKNVARVLAREIEVARVDVEGKRILKESYDRSKDKRIIEIPEGFPRYLYQKVISQYKEPFYIIYPSRYSDTWKVEAIQKSPDSLISRKPFPESWCGGVNGDPNLPIVSKVPDAFFCHRGGFLANIKSKEGAYAFAMNALAYKSKKKFNIFKWHS